MGFPSTVPIDPVMRIAMPAAADFKRSEERRLCYVATTRARRGVLLVTGKNRESSILMEPIRDHGIVRTHAIGEVVHLGHERQVHMGDGFLRHRHEVCRRPDSAPLVPSERRRVCTV